MPKKRHRSARRSARPPGAEHGRRRQCHRRQPVQRPGSSPVEPDHGLARWATTRAWRRTTTTRRSPASCWPTPATRTASRPRWTWPARTIPTKRSPSSASSSRWASRSSRRRSRSAPSTPTGVRTSPATCAWRAWAGLQDPANFLNFTTVCGGYPGRRVRLRPGRHQPGQTSRGHLRPGRPRRPLLADRPPAARRPDGHLPGQ